MEERMNEQGTVTFEHIKVEEKSTISDRWTYKRGREIKGTVIFEYIKEGKKSNDQ